MPNKNKKCLVYETLGNVGNLEIQHVNEGVDNFMRLSGVFGICGIKNDNRRIYSKDNYGKMVESLQNEISKNGVLGELEHPNSMNINLDNVSHMIESIEMNNDGTVTGTIKLLNTAKGKNAQAIIEGGAPLYISSRGAGSIDESGHVTLTTIKTYDLVGTPGFSQAKLQLNENQTLESLNENLAIIFEDESSDASSMVAEPNPKPKDNEPDLSSENNKNNDNKKVDKVEISKEDVEKLYSIVNKLKEEVDGLKKDNEELKKDNDDLKDDNDDLKNETAELKKDVAEALKAKVNYKKIQEWVMNEYTPMIVEKIATGVQNWVSEEYTESMQNWLNEEFTQGIEGWIISEYTPIIEKWIINEYSPVVESYVINEFGGAVNEWAVNEFAAGINEWMVTEYSPTAQKWIIEEFAPVIDKWVVNESNKEMMNNINDFMEHRHDNSLENIDRMLESISNIKDNDTALQMLKESKTEDKYANVYAVKNMPDQYLPSWNMLSESRKDEIVTASRVYNFSKEGVLESFWAGVDFGKKAKAPVNESKQYSTDSFVNNIVAQMKAMHS